MSAYAPFNISYAEYPPYLSVAEYQNAPTAIDTSNLLAGANNGAQIMALEETIARASSLMDSYLFGAYGTLNATVNTENARVWSTREGRFIVHSKYWPVLEVQDFSFGTGFGSSTSITPDGNVWVEPSQFVVSFGGAVGLGLGSLAGVAPCQPYFCQWTYVNGWPNTTLSVAASSGASSIELASVVGVYPGTHLTVFDLPADEQVTVASGYVPGQTSVPLVSALVSNHQAGVQVSNLPKVVKQAAISLTTFLVKVRGSGALVADDLGEVRTIDTGKSQGAMSDYELAKQALNQLRTPYVGY